MRNTKDQWIIYGDIDFKLERYTDFNFQSDHDDNKSVSDYIFTLYGEWSTGRVSSSTQ